MTERPMPHCDSRVLHAPGVCVFCDRRPDLQKHRRQMGMAFTDDPSPHPGAIQDIATQYRPIETINKWFGNRPVKPRKKCSYCSGSGLDRDTCAYGACSIEEHEGDCPVCRVCKGKLD